MNCNKCVLIMACAMQKTPEACKNCKRKNCTKCDEFCLCSFDGINLFNDGLTDKDIKKLVKIYQGAFGPTSDYRREYTEFCYKLAEENIDIVMEFYNYMYWFNSSFAVKIRCLYCCTPYKDKFRDYIKSSEVVRGGS